MRAIRSTRTATTSDCTRAPTTKQYAPAPLAASVTLTSALKTKPTAIAFISASCWNLRWMTPTDTAVMPSSTMVRVSRRTSGVASGLPAKSASAGAASQNSAYHDTLKAIAMVVAVAAMSATSPRHWTVAAIMPMSFTWMTNALAARAIA